MVILFNHSSDVPWTGQCLEEDIEVKPKIKDISVHRGTSGGEGMESVKANISKARRILYSLAKNS